MVKGLKSLVLALVGLIFLALGQPVLAEKIESKDIITPQAYTYLKETKCYFIDSGNGQVSVSGDTRTYSMVDKMITTVYLQRKTSTGWVNVKSWTNTEMNDTYCTVDGTITVTKGYEYRAYCYHQVNVGNLTETNTSLTTAYWVE